MGFFRKKAVDLDKGKKIFFECKGNSFNIDRDWGEDYYDCNVPKEIEQKWQKEIEANWPNELSELLTQIKTETIVSQVSSLLYELAMFEGLTYENRVNHFRSYLKDNKLDAFTTILLCEDLKLIKRYNRYQKIPNIALNSEIDEIIKFYVRKMLSESITIDNSYKKLRYMQNYDFSDENIKNRIKDLLE